MTYLSMNPAACFIAKSISGVTLKGSWVGSWTPAAGFLSCTFDWLQPNKISSLRSDKQTYVWLVSVCMHAFTSYIYTAGCHKVLDVRQ